MQWFASSVFKHKAALRKQSGAAQAAGKNILFACLSMLFYHRGADFAMNSARTKPVPYPTETQLNLYKPVSFLPHLSAFGVWESFRAVSKARRDFFTRISLFFRNPCASLCGQTFDTPFPLSLFLSAERYGRRKQYGICISVGISFRILREFVRKLVRSRSCFSKAVNVILFIKNSGGFRY